MDNIYHNGIHVYILATLCLRVGIPCVDFMQLTMREVQFWFCQASGAYSGHNGRAHVPIYNEIPAPKQTIFTNYHSLWNLHISETDCAATIATWLYTVRPR